MHCLSASKPSRARRKSSPSSCRPASVWRSRKAPRRWFALQLGPSTFGVFDAFADEAGRQAHLNGPIAQSLGANAPKLLAQAPSIERIDVLGAKLPGSRPARKPQ
jgi:quinol monooxygenase YgiN